MRTNLRAGLTWVGAALGLAIGMTNCGGDDAPAAPTDAPPDTASTPRGIDGDMHSDHDGEARTLYVWAGDQARVAPTSWPSSTSTKTRPRYGRVISTVPVPPPATLATSRTTATCRPTRTSWPAAGCSACCSGQNSIFFFDVSTPRHPKFLFSTRARSRASPTTSCRCRTAGFWSPRWVGHAAAPAGGRRVRRQPATSWPSSPRPARRRRVQPARHRRRRPN